jgi:hypothetical protein
MAALLRPSRRYRLRNLFAATARAALDRLKSLLDAQRSADLAWRVLLERLQEAADEQLR